MDSISKKSKELRNTGVSASLLTDMLMAAPQGPDQGMFCINTETGEMQLSENLTRILNLPESRYSIQTYLSHIDERDRNKIRFHLPENHQQAEVIHDEYNIIPPGGSRKKFISYSRLLHINATQSFIIANITDNTSSHEINKSYQEKMTYIDMALDNSVDMFCAFDRNLNCIAWNKKCEEITGFLKSEAFGKPAGELFPVPRKEKVIAGLEGALNGEITKVLIDEVAPETLIIEKFIVPLKDHKGRIFGAMIIGHDITAIKATSNRLKELYQAIKEKNAELERSNNELASFSYIASHDLQEPLRKIQTFSRKILETDHKNLSDSGKDSFRRIENAAQRMQSLINDLLTFSRTNTLPKEFHSTDLNAVLFDVKTELREVIDSKKATILSDELPTCMVIAFQMRQLMENILNNSLKYSRPEVPPVITIKYENVKTEDIPSEVRNEASKYFRLTISDNGIGFEPQYSEKIFELFQRLHGKHEYPGTGLGLAICKKIVQNHNGMITAEGEPGVGAKIIVTLPFLSDPLVHHPSEKLI